MTRHATLASLLMALAAASSSTALMAQEKTDKKKLVPLKANVNTAGKDKMAWWIGSYNKTVVNLKAFKTDNAIAIAFDIDTNAWGKVPPVNQCFSLLVRVFDEDGKYLTHFTTAEVFTANENVFNAHNGVYKRVTQAYARAGQKPSPGKARRPVLLKDKKNVLQYGVNRRDFRDAVIIEVGFYERPGR